MAGAAATAGTAAAVEGRERNAVILFTAFEPSGDAHAAPIIAALKQLDPSVRVCAWGGKAMAEAGAEIIEETAADGTMGLSSLSRIFATRRDIAKIARWIGRYKVSLHVAVDSPAANFPICKMARKRSIRSAHLVAPQVWAWGGWRVKKLRRLTGGIMCVLPFEEAWFRERQIPAKFIGHPRVNRELDREAIDRRKSTLPTGSPRMLLLPGSRSGEVRRNIKLMVRVFSDLQDRHRGMAGLICAASEELARMIRSMVPSMPNGLHMITGELDPAIAWCDLALAVSGTVTLDVARQFKPMVGIYKVDPISRLGALFLLRSRHRLLPNIVAGKRIVPEFVPFLGGVKRVVNAADHLLQDTRRLAQASDELKRVASRFRGHLPHLEAARLILALLDHGTWTSEDLSGATGGAAGTEAART